MKHAKAMDRPPKIIECISTTPQVMAKLVMKSEHKKECSYEISKLVREKANHESE